MVSFPDELLERVDAEVVRRGTTRSGLLQVAARREVGELALPRDEIITRLDRVASGWSGPVDAVEELRADRARMPARSARR
jgi:hypothetical protein